jgi:hypothetical protein
MEGVQNIVLGLIFESKEFEVTEKLRKLHNEKLPSLFCSANIVRVIHSRNILYGWDM